MELTIDHLLEKIEVYLPSVDHARVRAAYDLAASIHSGQVRFSGEPYISHPLATTDILLSLKPDEDTIVASLLHHAPKGDGGVSLDDIGKRFSPDVVALIQSTRKLNLVKLQGNRDQVEVWRKMFLAMAKDLRVIFIKLASRLHNMRTLEHVPKEKRLEIAEETLRVYAPVASRLGIYAIKSELEDLSFRHLYPEEYTYIKTQLEQHGHVHDKHLAEAQAAVQRLLDDEGIEAKVTGRIKHLYSIYRKLKKKNVTSLDNIYDLFALRIILPDQYREGREFVGHCYTLLGALHNRWTPMPGRFKDYIAVPKLNGYRSLHSTLIGVIALLKHQPLEVQLRTQGMHDEAEYGIASHWWYKDDAGSQQIDHDEVERFLNGRRLLNRLHELLNRYPKERSKFERLLSPHNSYDRTLEYELRRFLEGHDFISQEVTQLLNFLNDSSRLDGRLKTLQHQIDWLYGLQDFQEEGEEADAAEFSLFNDRIFVLTPGGDVKDLPSGATPVDFAYAIHTDLGHRCAQAKVNGSIAKLDQTLSSGDIVEIITKKQPGPNRYWLSFVHTSSAKSKIKSWFRSVDRERNIKEGRAILNRLLRRLNKPLLGPNYQLLSSYGGKRLNLSDREHIVELVGNGTISASHVIKTLFSESDLMGAQRRNIKHAPKLSSPSKRDAEQEILITGESDLPILLSACCKPKFPAEIVGLVTRGQAIRVHRNDCYQLSKTNPDRLLEASWASAETPATYQVKIRLQARDRVGLLRDIVQVVADMNMNILDFPLVEKTEERLIRELAVEIPNYDRLTQLLYKLEAVEGVISVKKI